MKRPACIILMLLMTVQTFSQTCTWVVFKINQAWIEKKQCENRTRPQLQCHGRCVLMKKIKQQEEQDRKYPSSLKQEPPAQILSSHSFFPTLIESKLYRASTKRVLLNIGQPIDRTFSFFHPPQSC